MALDSRNRNRLDYTSGGRSEVFLQWGKNKSIRPDKRSERRIEVLILCKFDEPGRMPETERSYLRHQTLLSINRDVQDCSVSNYVI